MLKPATALNFLLSYKYAALLPLACLEGPMVALAVGFLTRLGYFSFLPAFLIMILGDFIPDSIYYAIGHLGNKQSLTSKYDTKSNIISRHLALISKMWFEHPIKTMFVSKLAYGFSIPLLVTAGLAHMPYRKFIWHALHVTIFQYGLIMTLGYYLGQSYMAAGNYIKYAEVSIGVLAAAFVIMYFILQRYM